MARPRETEKRRELAQRAAAVLEEKGLTIPTEQLARELGLNRTTLLYHFPTYSEIIQTVLGELLLEQAAFVEAKVAEHEHPIDRLFARVRAVHAYHHGNERRLLFLTQAPPISSRRAAARSPRASRRASRRARSPRATRRRSWRSSAR